ncbi:GIY-YIG nuclease family protein [Patescibacteria group bacterium]|nr:GIY-YIG nuclease family protein [Patescibacteria group bacterium]MCG2702721.1 GIY-YIG nuclease family protein [Candidatus Parcubacteria bacterium]MBU4265571.1 GIY-YIG nuclease family protein [Patescibacteria group bacterium]MBU4390031.1 GIY-YIG nuclease family protein [Patescibacteria group bacterium]MBU4430988.1 GIY-YIG nuclease family protein [Patescibacteria group bacterium]
MYFVYILRCSNGQIYTGCTSDLKERLDRHKNGQVPATKSILPVKLIWYGYFVDKYKAFHFERYLKSGSGKALAQKRLT